MDGQWKQRLPRNSIRSISLRIRRRNDGRAVHLFPVSDRRPTRATLVIVLLSSSNGPTESRGKSAAHSFRHFPRSLIQQHRSGLSSRDESPQSFSSPSINEQQIDSLIQLKVHPSNTPQHPYSSYPKTICTHCKSHQMPECLYTCKCSPWLVRRSTSFVSSSSFHVRRKRGLVLSSPEKMSLRNVHSCDPS